MNYDVAIIGAGPAGMMAALTAAQNGARVLLCEQLRRPGAKLLVTGGGRCNLTNVLDAQTLAARFGKNGRFMRSALAAMDGAGLRRFLESIGVPTHCTDGFHVFPVSESALQVRDTMMRQCEETGVEIRTRLRVTGLASESTRICGIETDSGRLPARCIILATGGRSYPQLGATGSGYDLARSVGHSIVEPIPALVPLIIKEQWPSHCPGVTLSDADVRVDLPKSKVREHGIVLVTHRGLSGPAILDISGELSASLAASGGPVALRVNVDNSMDESAWLALFEDWQRQQGRKLIRTLLTARLPASFVAELCKMANIDDDTRAVNFTKAQRRALVESLTALRVIVLDTEGWEKAIVTRGGVALGEVDQRTLGSRKIEGLYFAGEVLDLDGPCGGYNLTWAFSSGHLAGESAAQAARDVE